MSVERFWCHEASNIRCVRESDYDALAQQLAASEARCEWLAEMAANNEREYTKQLVKVNARDKRLAEAEELLREVRKPLDLRAEFDPTYPPNTTPLNDCAEAVLLIDAFLSPAEDKANDPI